MGMKGLGKYQSVKDFPRFGKITVELGFVTEEQLKIALNEQVESNLSNNPHSNLGEIFLKKRWITLEQIISVLEQIRKEGHNVSAFINAIKRDIRTLTSIILVILTTLLLINLRFLSTILNYIPPVSIGFLFLIILGLVFICIHLSRLIVKNAINELEAYDGKMTNYLSSLEQEVKERKQLEEKILLQSKHDWETTFDNVNEFITVINNEGRISRCNRSFADFVKIPIKDTVGVLYSELIPINPEQIKPGMPSTKIEAQTKQGEWLYISYYPILDEKSQFLRGVIICTDITGLKYTQDKLARSEKQHIDRIEELERFYEMAVNRELKMKGLKEENKKLKSDLSLYIK
jgi:PAS domain-containing protein